VGKLITKVHMRSSRRFIVGSVQWAAESVQPKASYTDNRKKKPAKPESKPYTRSSLIPTASIQAVITQYGPPYSCFTKEQMLNSINLNLGLYTNALRECLSESVQYLLHHSLKYKDIIRRAVFPG
jgi:hypothetical protein